MQDYNNQFAVKPRNDSQRERKGDDGFQLETDEKHPYEKARAERQEKEANVAPPREHAEPERAFEGQAL